MVVLSTPARVVNYESLSVPPDKATWPRLYAPTCYVEITNNSDIPIFARIRKPLNEAGLLWAPSCLHYYTAGGTELTEGAFGCSVGAPDDFRILPAQPEKLRLAHFSAIGIPHAGAYYLSAAIEFHDESGKSWMFMTERIEITILAPDRPTGG